MNKSKIMLYAFINSIGTLVYVSLVSFIIMNGEKIFGKMNNLMGPIAFLLLFVLSATITGALVIDRPIYLYLNDLKKEAAQMFLFTVGWLFVITVLALMINILIK